LTQHIVDSRLGLANIGHAQRSQFATQFTAILALANHSLRMLGEFGFQLVKVYNQLPKQKQRGLLGC
jgi:hypothetical protein